jgi:hypothetical protein
MAYLGVAFVPFYLTVLAHTLLTGGSVATPLLWTLVAAFFVLERAWAVKRGGWRSVALSALVVPEIAYDLFLHIVYLKAAIDAATGARETWAYTAPTQIAGVAGGGAPGIASLWQSSRRSPWPRRRARVCVHGDRRGLAGDRRPGPRRDRTRRPAPHRSRSAALRARQRRERQPRRFTRVAAAGLRQRGRRGGRYERCHQHGQGQGG